MALTIPSVVVNCLNYSDQVIVCHFHVTIDWKNKNAIEPRCRYFRVGRYFWRVATFRGSLLSEFYGGEELTFLVPYQFRIPN